MDSNAIQGELFSLSTAKAGTVVVNERVTLRTAEGYRVVCVDGLVLHHYGIGDRMAEAYTMVILIEEGYADQNDIARTFGYATRTLRRYQDHLKPGASRPWENRAVVHSVPAPWGKLTVYGIRRSSA